MTRSGTSHRHSPDSPRPEPRPSRASRKPSARSRTSARPTCVTPNGYEADYEALLEFRAAQVFQARPDVAEVLEQPAPVHYVDDANVVRSHTFDLLLRLRDGTRIAVIVKPSALVAQRGTERLRDLLAAQTPASFAQQFLIVTERDLDRGRVAVAKLVHAARRCPDPERDAELRTMVASLEGPTSVQDLVEASGLGASGLMAVARLVGEGRLTLADERRLDFAAIVAKRPDERAA